MRHTCLLVLLAVGTVLSAATVRVESAQPPSTKDLIAAVDAYRAVADLKVHECRLDEPRYRVVGNTGIATGVLRWRMTYQGRDSSLERRTTMTWVRDGTLWRMLAQHVARLK